MIEALSEEQLDYRPHPESRSARELSSHIIYGDIICVELARAGRVDYQEPAPAANRQELLDRAEKADAEFRAQLDKLTDEDWERKVTFKAGKREFPVVLGEFLWFILFGLIHHRGQLSTYIRPMGGKVPSIYGPSGDERRGL